MKMQHVTIQTKHFEDEIAFYEKFAHLTVQHDMRGGPMDIVFMGEDEGGAMVEIISNPDVENAGGDGISMGFHAEDLEGLRSELEEAGVQVTQMISPQPGVRFFFAKDPAGVTVQFI